MAQVPALIPSGATPGLILPNGQPMRREVLTQRVAGPSITGVRSIYSGHPAQNLTPGKLTSLLRAAEQGAPLAYFELAEEMEEKDLHYLSVIGTRKRQVAQLPITVDPASKDPAHERHADFVREWIERDELQDELFNMLDGIGKGFSITEMVWEFSPKRWWPGKLEWCDPRFFEFDKVDGVTPLMRGDDGTPQPLDAAKYIVHFHQAKSGLPIRGGLARAAAWSYLFKNYAMKDWVGFLETYGLPIRLGRYDNGETEENRRILMNALAQLGSDAAAIFPKTMEVEFIDGKGGTIPADMWQALADFCDMQVSKAVLGQTATTDAKIGGLGSGKEHGDVRADIERADAKKLAASITRDAVIPMIVLNFGRQDKYPRIRIGHEDPVDIAQLVDAATKLAPFGVRIGKEGMRKAAGLPAPEDGEEVLEAPTATPAIMPPENGATEAPGALGGPGVAKLGAPAFSVPLKTPTGAVPNAGADRKVAAALTDPAADPDFVDLTTDEALGDWEAIMDALIVPVEDLAGTAATLETFRDRLVDALETMDVTAFTALAERAGFAAHLKGELDVSDEVRAEGGGATK